MGLEFFDQVYLDEQRFGTSIPFELTVKTFYYPEGKLGFDISSIRLLEGSEKIVFTDFAQHGRWMNKFVKLVIGKTMASLLVEVESEDQDVEQTDESRRLALLSGRLMGLQREMEEILLTDSLNADEKFIALSKIEIEKNPFIEEGVQRSKGKAKAIFKDVFGTDEESEQLIFLLDPKAVVDVKQKSLASFRVWDFKPIYSKNDNQVYLKASVGQGEASQDFLDLWRGSQEEQDSLLFTGLSEEPIRCLDQTSN